MPIDLLSRRIWTRTPSEPFRFLFVRGKSPRLVLERMTEKGTSAFLAARKSVAEGATIVVGVTLVDHTGKLVFVTKSPEPQLLAEIGAYARAEIPRTPALVDVVGSGHAVADFAIKDATSIRSLDVFGLEIRRDPSCWGDLSQPDLQDMARMLADCPIGTRLWFWIWPDGPSGPQALFQRVSADPRRQQLGVWITANSPDGMDQGHNGVAVMVEDGTLQLMGASLDRGALTALARFVHAHIGEAPGLARLAGATLLETDESAVVRRVHADPDAWSGIARPIVPGTLGEAAQTLAELAVGADAWFWLAGPGRGGPFVSALPVSSDLQGTAFGGRLDAFRARFPGQPDDALQGTVRRLTDGSLLFTTNQAIRPWGAAIRQLIDRYGARYDAFNELERARVVRFVDGRVAAAATVATL